MSYSLARLLQLASPALPVGAYSYSQGLEWAAEAGTVHDEASVAVWIEDLLREGVGQFEAPLLAQAIAAAAREEWAELHRLNAVFLASRESSELRNETLQMGHSLRVLLDVLPNVPPACLAAVHAIEAPSFVTVWGAIAAAWKIPAHEAVTAYLWAWAENQVMAAVKIVPLGQAAGQRLLLRLGDSVTLVAEAALQLDEMAWSNFAPGFAIASCRHELQYTRLFRS
jgi:urease accessory protein